MFRKPSSNCYGKLDILEERPQKNLSSDSKNWTSLFLNKKMQSQITKAASMVNHQSMWILTASTTKDLYVAYGSTSLPSMTTTSLSISAAPVMPMRKILS